MTIFMRRTADTGERLSLQIKMMRRKIAQWILLGAAGGALLASPLFSLAAVQEEISNRQRQIDELIRQVQDF